MRCFHICFEGHILGSDKKKLSKLYLKINEEFNTLFEICLQNNLSKLYSVFLCSLIILVINFKLVAGFWFSFFPAMPGW